jgi:hypothetical protein
VTISPAVAFVSAQLVYRGGSVSKVKLYRASISDADV